MGVFATGEYSALTGAEFWFDHRWLWGDVATSTTAAFRFDDERAVERVEVELSVRDQEQDDAFPSWSEAQTQDAAITMLGHWLKFSRCLPILEKAALAHPAR